MSTKVSTIHDSIVAQMLAIFSTKTRIPNPYSLEDNPKQFLSDGYGIKFNGSQRLSFEICNRREKASFSAVFTREFLKIDNNQTAFDSPEKAILEDVETFKQTFYDNNNLNNSDIMLVDVTTVSGISNVVGDKFNFLTVEVNFDIDYFEHI